MTHPFYFDRLVAERHTQIQHDMQLSRVQVRAVPQSTSQISEVTRLDTRLRKPGKTVQRSLRRAS